MRSCSISSTSHNIVLGLPNYQPGHTRVNWQASTGLNCCIDMTRTLNLDFALAQVKAIRLTNLQLTKARAPLHQPAKARARAPPLHQPAKARARAPPLHGGSTTFMLEPTLTSASLHTSPMQGCHRSAGFAISSTQMSTRTRKTFCRCMSGCKSRIPACQRIGFI